MCITRLAVRPGCVRLVLDAAAVGLSAAAFLPTADARKRMAQLCSDGMLDTLGFDSSTIADGDRVLVQIEDVTCSIVWNGSAGTWVVQPSKPAGVGPARLLAVRLASTTVPASSRSTELAVKATVPKGQQLQGSVRANSNAGHADESGNALRVMVHGHGQYLTATLQQQAATVDAVAAKVGLSLLCHLQLFVVLAALCS